MQKILISADHAGFELKQALILFLHDMDYEVKDFGATSFNPEDDYPDYVMPLAEEISLSDGTLMGIIIGGSGQGEAIAANRFPYVRAAVFNGQYHLDQKRVPLEVKTAREHNNANILSLGARFLSEADAKDAVKTFLTTPFTRDERHIRRLKKIEEYGKRKK